MGRRGSVSSGPVEPAGPGAEGGPRVLVADGHPPTRAWVCEALRRGGCEVIAEAADAAAAVDVARTISFDVALLDLRMPGGGGLATAQEISLLRPEAAVVMFTESPDDEDLFAALRAGASGYLLKDIAPEGLARALHGVLRGEAAIPRRFVRTVIEQFRAQSPQARWGEGVGAGRLTKRESEVLDLMVAGRSTEEIASALYVAPVTVRTHVRAVLKKLGLPDRQSAIRALRDKRTKGS